MYKLGYGKIIAYICCMAILFYPLVGTITVVASSYIYNNIYDYFYYDSKTLPVRIEEDGQGHYYYYRVNDNEYSCKMDSELDDTYLDSTTIVYYQSKNPTVCVLKPTTTTIIFSSVISVIAAGLFWLFLGVQFIRAHILLWKMIRLNKNGKLIKNVPYYLTYGDKLHTFSLTKAVVPYKTPSGKEIKLKEFICYYQFSRSSWYLKEEGTVDLLIDENNPKLFYFNYSIKRKKANDKENRKITEEK